MTTATQTAPANGAKASPKAAAFANQARRPLSETMAASLRAPFAGLAPFAQLQCACGGSGGSSGECDSCQKKKRLQRKAAHVETRSTPSHPDAKTAQGGAAGSASGGSWLSKMERAFGHSFGGVRIHHDAAADQAAKSLHAHAFTVGQDVYFARGQFAPESQQGFRLLAHELSHTVQQRGMTSSQSLPSREADAADFAVDPVDAPLEREADAAAEAVLQGARPSVSIGSAVSVARAARVQAFVQREGENVTTITKPKEKGKTTTITRTLVNRPCKSRNETRETPSKQIPYWDESARAVGFRYKICNGKVQLETGGEIQYDQVFKAGETLLNTLKTNPGSLNVAVQDAVNNTQITADSSVTFTVDSVLQVGLTSNAAAGTQAQSFNVKAKVIIAPGGNVRVQIDGGVGFDKTALGSQNTYTLSGSVGNDSFVLKVDYQQIDFSPISGGKTSTNTITGTGAVQLGKGSSIGLQATGSREGGVTGGLVFNTTFGGDKPKPVKCYCCDCPPPIPEYRCQTVTDAYEEPVVTRKADVKTLRMLQVYDDVAPLEPSTYAGQVSEIVGLVQNESSIQSIVGYASPEASVDYNAKLSRKRATATKSAIQSALTKQNVTATLPDITVGGELHGESTVHAGEAANKELTGELRKRLSALPDDEARLNFLQIEGERRTNPDRRAETLADIHAFMEDKPGKKSANGHEDLWEKIFPYLRRTDVTIDIREQSHMKQIPADPGKQGNCDADSVTYAENNMPLPPARQRLPTDECAYTPGSECSAPKK
jgi:Domain of unknown function (DUF4157)